MFADRIIFQPPPVTYNDTRRILKLSTVGGEQVSAIFLPNERSAFTILYSHGNAEDLGTVRYKMEALRQMGYSVLGYDYEGVWHEPRQAVGGRCVPRYRCGLRVPDRRAADSAPIRSLPMAGRWEGR